MPARRVLMGTIFFPRGGSAHVVRELAKRLPGAGWDVTLVSGSLPGGDGLTDARRFYRGIDVRPVEFDRALAAGDPMAADPPMHPSYEDRPGEPDRVFARLDDEAYERQAAAWSRAFADAGAAEADVIHLAHLTPLYEAAARVAPGVPVVGHLHGTELLMLEEIAAGPPDGWDHAEAWAERMRRWAAGCAAIVCGSDDLVARAVADLPVERDRFTVITNGVDTDAFDRRPIDRRAHWRRHLVERPQGWRPGAAPGSVAYTEHDIAPLLADDAVVSLYVGRFTAVKRVPLLIRAHTRARREFRVPAPLVILGGHPGEWEGEHPYEAIAASGAESVFLAGWHEHDVLPDFLNASDVSVLASVREQFGQVLVEGMACAVPAIAVAAHGPAEIIDDGETGWLVPPDDEAALAAALVAAVNDGPERRRRGERARAVARERYGWPALAARLAAVLDAVAGR